MAEQQATGWYPEPSDPTQEIYWDGTQWHGRRDKFPALAASPAAPTTPPPTASEPPQPHTTDPTPRGKTLAQKRVQFALYLLAAALAVIFLFTAKAMIEGKGSSTGQRPVNQHSPTSTSATAPTTTTTTTTTTTPTSPKTRVPDVQSVPPPDEVASAAKTYIAEFVVAPNGDLKQTLCEDPSDPNCWPWHVDKFTVDQARDEFGVIQGTLKVWLDGNWDPSQRMAFGRKAANSVATMLMAADNQAQVPSILYNNVKYVQAVDQNGDKIADGTPRR